MRYLARETAPRADDKKCLNYHFKGHCRSCAAVCPHGAVILGDRISIDQARCSGCGICAAACPTRCLQMPEPDWEAVLTRAINHPEPCLGCRRLLTSEANIFVPCLGGLPEEFLATFCLLRDTALNLDLTACFECNQKPALRQLRRTLIRAKRLTGGKLKVKMLWPDRAAEKEGNILDKENLARFGRNLQDVSSSLISYIVPGGLADDQAAVKNMSLLRSLLLKGLSLNKNAALQLTTFRVDQACSGCGFCRAVCPQDAWELTFMGSEAVLFHYPLRCTGCGLCAAQCPEKAKSRELISWNAGLENRLETRIFPAGECSGCQKPLLKKDCQTAYCFSCRSRAELKRSIQQVPGKV